ncbi:MAG: chemotaxis response regulator protein-glutamate methylesterase [Lachnospiraceae bacterium]|nr:chemotaxis response regulator protein-glutamate methylesterase [Lachnospiraceae bacterium]
MRQIRVLVVEDSLLFRELLVRNLNADPGITVVASARDPYEARDAIIEHRPDVITLDIELPRMDGIEFLRRLIPQHPIPVVVISSLSDKVFEAMSAGAVDFVAKPANATRAQLDNFMRNELAVKVKIASIAKVGNKKRTPLDLPRETLSEKRKDLVVAIGASTGGTEAIATVLKEFDTDIPGVVIVQHMPAKFTEMYANRLNEKCVVRVKEAKTGDVVTPGQVLIAPGGDAHMKIIRKDGVYQVVIRQGPKVNGHCPSVDVLFESVAQVAGDKAVGIILTGMGGDGSKGLLAMRNAGAHTIGQDESSCVVYGMPKVAYDIGAVEYQERLPDIAKKTYSLLSKM